MKTKETHVDRFINALIGADIPHPLRKDESATPPCQAGLEPHDFQVEDFSPEQADLKCRNCGHQKRQ